MARHGVAATQQLGRVVHIAHGQGSPHARTGNPVSCAVPDVGERANLKTMPRAERAQHIDVACALAAEAEILPDQQPARAQCVNQEFFDEILGGHVGKGAVESRQQHATHAGIGKGGQFVTQASDLRGDQFGAVGQAGEVLARVRRKGQHRGRQAARCPGGTDGLQHGLVAAVHAVEVADREGCFGPMRIPGRVPEYAKNGFHGRQFTIYGCINPGRPCQLPPYPALAS